MTVMRTAMLAILPCLMLIGCGQKTQAIPENNFHLTVENESDHLVILKIEISQSAWVGAGCSNRLGNLGGSIAMDKVGDTNAEGRIFLSSANMDNGASEKTNFSKLQIVLKLNSVHGGGVTCTGDYPVRSNETPNDNILLAVTNGNYKYSSPLTIAMLQGEPLTLVVTTANGKPSSGATNLVGK